jgi:hypothetical protein
MNANNDCSEGHLEGDSQLVDSKSAMGPFPLDTYGGRVHVEWDPEGAVTPLGQLSFFIDFLKTAELFDPWVSDCPLDYVSPNAPKKRDVLGTIFMSVLAGHKRYAHMSSIRCDGVNPALLGMSKVVSADSARRAFKSVDAEAFEAWQVQHLRRCYEPLLYSPWILDIDSTVKPLYGHQEGAVLGYNPQKPGRPSHVFHTYFMANTRLVLDVEVGCGNETAAKYSMPGLWRYLDSLPRAAWPQFIRGDCAFGNERDMNDAEGRGLPYLFKLRQTSGVKHLIQQAFSHEDWKDAGQGWEGVEDSLRLSGWTAQRRVIVLRRRVRGSVALQNKVQKNLGKGQLELADAKRDNRLYEYVVLVTSLTDEIAAIGQHYRDRGDAENNFDELKNQWGWSGYTTRDMKRSQIMVRIIAQVYNWWSLYVGLAIPDRHAEAITSRPLLLHGVARQNSHAGQRTITITSSHAEAHRIQQVLNNLSAFLSKIKSTARQLTRRERWQCILSRIFVRFLKNTSLRKYELFPAPG